MLRPGDNSTDASNFATLVFSECHLKVNGLLCLPASFGAITCGRLFFFLSFNNTPPISYWATGAATAPAAAGILQNHRYSYLRFFSGGRNKKQSVIFGKNTYFFSCGGAFFIFGAIQGLCEVPVLPQTSTFNILSGVTGAPGLNDTHKSTV